MSFSTSDVPNLQSLGVTARAATPEDAAFLKDLFMQVRSAVFAPLGMPAEQVCSLLEMQFQGRERQYRNDYPNAETSILERNDARVGAAVTDDREDGLHLIDISIVASHQRGGIGEALLRDIKRQNERLSLKVENFNPARRLYEREGFVETSNDGVYASMTWTV